MTKTIAATLRAPKARNPFVAAARFRRAGSHSLSPKGMRQQATRSLKRELTELRPHSP